MMLAIAQLVSRYITGYHKRIWAARVRYVTNMNLTNPESALTDASKRTIFKFLERQLPK